MHGPDAPLTTDAEILEVMQHLVGQGLRRQVWLFFLDRSQRLMPVAGPLEGVPVDADPDDVALLALRLRETAQDVPGVAGVVLVWERPGPPTLRMQEADWIAGLAASDAPVRLQLLASDDGVRVVDPAFEAIVAA